MRHRKAGVKLNMTSSHKQAMFRNMVTSLFKHDRIRTTNAKAKELRRLADHMVTLAKRGDLHARRQAMSVIREKDVVHKLFEEASDRFGTASGGYTRIIKLGHRPGDAAPVSLIELITTDDRDKKKPAKKAKAAAPQKVAEKAVDKAAAEEKAPEAEAEAEVAAEDGKGADSVSEAPEATAAAQESAEPDEAAAGKKAEASQPDAAAPESDDKEAEESKDKSE